MKKGTKIKASRRTYAGNTTASPQAELRTAAIQLLRNGASLVQSSSKEHIGRFVLRERGTTGERDTSLPLLLEERCVLIIDLVGWSKKSMEEQLALVESMNGALLRANEEMLGQARIRATRIPEPTKVWDSYKGTGDGAIFAFGQGLNPESVRVALVFAARAMVAFERHNNALAPEGMNRLAARMALAYGKVYITEGLDGKTDIIGNAINVCARLVSSKRATSGVILVEDSIFHSTMINAERYYRNEDDTTPTAGELSDFVLGTEPDASNFLYFQDDGLHETKDRVLHAYNLSGRLGGIDIRPSR